jgi:hypothetical protein
MNYVHKFNVFSIPRGDWSATRIVPTPFNSTCRLAPSDYSMMRRLLKMIVQSLTEKMDLVALLLPQKTEVESQAAQTRRLRLVKFLRCCLSQDTHQTNVQVCFFLFTCGARPR